MTRARELSSSDFVRGVLLGAALQGVWRYCLSDARFDRAMVSAYGTLRRQAPLYGVEPSFALRLSGKEGWSDTVRAEITRAVRYEPGSQSFQLGPRGFLVVEFSFAAKTIAQLPGDEGLYEMLAKEFLHDYFGLGTVTNSDGATI